MPAAGGLQAALGARWDALSREQQDTLFLLAVIALVALPHASHQPAWATGMTVVLLGWRAWLALKLKPLPRRWLLFALLALCVGGTFLTFRTITGRDAGVTLVTMLLTLKTLELRARRDAFVVFFLGFFSVLTHFLFSQSIATALLMVAAVAALFAALVGAHMPVGKPKVAQRFALAGKMMLLGTPLAIALFLFFPRLAAPLWGLPGDAQQGKTGLSEQFSMGDLAELALDDSIAFRIEFEGGRAPLPDLLYFRGPVMGTTSDGKSWQQERRFDTFAQMRPGVRVKGEGIRQTITLEPHRRAWVFALEHPAAPPQIAGLEVAVFPTMQLHLVGRKSSVTERVRYSVESFPDTEHGPLSANPFVEGYLRQYVELPPGFNPRTLQYAADLRRDARYADAPAEQLVELLLAQIARGGYSYSLAPGLYGTHAVDEFWFDRKVGFCEHFAGAFVVLLRALDVPARIVTGYQGAELNPFDGSYVVRHSHAHAWVEYWQAGRGWVRADPTAAVAPERIRSQAGTLARQRGLLGLDVLSPERLTLLRTLRESWEAVNNAWNQWILAYTATRQLDLLKNIGFSEPDWASLAVLMIVLAAAATALAGAWLVWDRPRRDAWQRLHARTQRRLARLGVPSTAADAPRALAARLPAAWPGAEPATLSAWREALLALERLRYARADGGRADQSAALQALARSMAALPDVPPHARARPAAEPGAPLAHHAEPS
jgi:transglutaminase-like putative cysteine protease